MITRSQTRWLAFAIVMLSHLASLAVAAERVSQVTQALIVPSLAPLLWRYRRSRLVQWMLAGLLFSWIGDVAPRWMPEPFDFWAMAVPFWMAQLCYLVAFAPLRHQSVLARNPRSVVAYVAIVVGVVSWALPAARSLWPVPLIYGVSILAMALLATGLGRNGVWGGVLFMVSDALVAMVSFLPETHNRWTRIMVMVTYMLAQALLVRGVRKQVRGVARVGTTSDTGGHFNSGKGATP